MPGLDYSISQNLLVNNRNDMSSPMCQRFSLESSFVKQELEAMEDIPEVLKGEERNRSR